jgi:dihydroflavonol-4-reductase
MKILVTGGSGFIGSAVVRDLVTAGYEVVCLFRPTSNTHRVGDLPIERAVGDVRDAASVRAAMCGCAATIHLAAPGGWGNDEPSTLRQVIEGGTENVLTAAAEQRGHRVVHVSSTAAINGSERPRIFDERSPFTLSDPGLHYAHAKHRAEEMAIRASERGTPVVVVNPAEVYGPNDFALGTASNLVDFVKSSPVLVCHGGTSVVHVADVSTGIIRALQRGRSGERYILGGENLTIRDLARLVLELVNRRAPVVMVPRSAARVGTKLAIRLRVPLPFNPHVVPYATRYWFVDNSKAQRELGVRFRGARETIASTLDWLRQRALI